jgi:hypothetical protein
MQQQGIAPGTPEGAEIRVHGATLRTNLTRKAAGTEDAIAFIGCTIGQRVVVTASGPRNTRPMRIALTVFAVLTLMAGCAAVTRTAGDRAICESEPTDQVERRATREVCR